MRINLDDDSGTAELNMAPLIDCVFLLLIFFLVATTLKKLQEELKVELPEPARAAGQSKEREPFVVGIDSDGNFYVGATPAGRSEIHQQLRQIAETAPSRHIRIDVDRRAPSQYLIQVLDLCAYEGLNNYGIHTKSKRRYEGSDD